MSAYRETGVYYSRDELNDAEDTAREAEISFDRAVGRADYDAGRLAGWFHRAAAATAVMTLATVIAAAARAPGPAFITLAVQTGVLAATSATIFGFLVRATAALGAARDAHRAARAVLHRAEQRAGSERSRAGGGLGGRCRCAECKRDPLGYLAPYRKDGAP